MSNPAVDGTGNLTMYGTVQTTATPYVAPPVVELEEVPTVDLYHVAYRRDNTKYEDLLAALLKKVASIQANLKKLI